MSDLEKKAKTPLEIEKMVKEHIAIFRRGAMGDQDAYNEARDTRYLIEEDKWVRLEDALHAITRWGLEVRESFALMLGNKQKELDECEAQLERIRQLTQEFPRAVKIRHQYHNEKYYYLTDQLHIILRNQRDWLDRLKKELGE